MLLLVPAFGRLRTMIIIKSIDLHEKKFIILLAMINCPEHACLFSLCIALELIARSIPNVGPYTCFTYLTPFPLWTSALHPSGCFTATIWAQFHYVKHYTHKPSLLIVPPENTFGYYYDLDQCSSPRNSDNQMLRTVFLNFPKVKLIYPLTFLTNSWKWKKKPKTLHILYF